MHTVCPVLSVTIGSILCGHFYRSGNMSWHFYLQKFQFGLLLQFSNSLYINISIIFRKGFATVMIVFAMKQEVPVNFLILEYSQLHYSCHTWFKIGEKWQINIFEMLRNWNTWSLMFHGRNVALLCVCGVRKIFLTSDNAKRVRKDLLRLSLASSRVGNIFWPTRTTCNIIIV